MERPVQFIAAMTLLVVSCAAELLPDNTTLSKHYVTPSLTQQLMTAFHLRSASISTSVTRSMPSMSSTVNTTSLVLPPPLLKSSNTWTGARSRTSTLQQNFRRVTSTNSLAAHSRSRTLLSRPDTPDQHSNPEPDEAVSVGTVVLIIMALIVGGGALYCVVRWCRSNSRKLSRSDVLAKAEVQERVRGQELYSVQPHHHRVVEVDDIQRTDGATSSVNY